jgi:hypothetical protein
MGHLHEAGRITAVAVLGLLVWGCAGRSDDGNGTGTSNSTGASTGVTTDTHTMTGNSTGVATVTATTTGPSTGVATVTHTMTGNSTGVATATPTATHTVMSTAPYTKTQVATFTATCTLCGFACCAAGETCGGLTQTSDGYCYKTATSINTWSNSGT